METIDFHILWGAWNSSIGFLDQPIELLLEFYRSFSHDIIFLYFCSNNAENTFEVTLILEQSALPPCTANLPINRIVIYQIQFMNNQFFYKNSNEAVRLFHRPVSTWLIIQLNSVRMQIQCLKLCLFSSADV